MAAGYDGSIRIKALLNHNQFDRGIRSMGSSVESLKGTLLKLAGVVGAAFGVAAIVNFGRESVKAASELSDAWMGLQSIVEGQGRSFRKAQSFIESYISDGLVPLTDAVTAYKNLSARGYNDEQIQKTMTALKDAAAFGRQSTYSLGEAVATAAEGLKNENSILVDNAGVTKNVAKMWDEYAKSIGTTANNLTQEQKIQAEVNGILEETKFQTGDAAKLVNTYSGQIAMLGFNFQQLKVQVGNAIMPVVQAVLPGINAIISALVKLANVFAKVTALLFGKSTGTAGQVSTNEKIASSGAAAADATDKLADSTAGAGSASKKAAKDMKGVLAGFDELNILASKTSDSLGGAAGGIGDVGAGDIELPEVDLEGDPFEDLEESISSLGELFVKTLDDMLAGIPALKQAFLDFASSFNDFNQKLYDAFKFPGVLERVEQLGRELAQAFNALVNAIDWELWGRTLGAGLNLGLQFLTEFIYTFDWINLGQKLADFINGLVYEVDWYDFGRLLFAQFKIAFETLAGLITGLDMPALAKAASNIIMGFFDEMKNTFDRIDWGEIGEQVATFLSNIDWKGIARSVFEVIGSVFSAEAEYLGGLLGVPLSEAVTSIDMEPLISSFNQLLDALGPLIETIRDGLGWALENVLIPFGKWILEELAPVGIEVVTAALELLNSVLEALGPLATWLWETFLQPLAEWTGDLVINALGLLADALTAISDWISNNQPLFQAMVATLGIFFAAWEISKLLEFIGAAGNVSNALGILAGKISEVIASITGINTAILGIGAIIAGLVMSVSAFFTMWNEGFSLAQEAVMLVGIALTAVGAVLLGVPATVAAVVAGIVAAVATAAVLIHEHWDEIKEAAIKAWEAIKEAWSKAGEWFSENVVEPIKEFFSGLWEGITTLASEAWQGIQDIWSAVSGWFEENIITPVKEFFTGLWETVTTLASEAWSRVQEIWNVVSTWFSETVIEPVKEFFSGLWENVKAFASEAWGNIQEVWGVVSGWFSETVVEPVKKFFSDLWENVKKIASEAWETVKKAWESAGEWFHTNITEPIAKFFSEAWENITTAASKAWEAVQKGIHDFWDSVKSWWSGNVAKYFTAEYWMGLGKQIVDGLLQGLQGIFSGLTSWASDVWNSITGAFSMQKAKSSLSSGMNAYPRMAAADYMGYAALPARSLPKLANGAVIPPNQQFAAILGDQRKGYNIEAPAELIKEMVMKGIQAAGGVGNRGGDMTVIIQIDGREFGRAVVKYGGAEEQRIGVRLAKGASV